MAYSEKMVATLRAAAPLDLAKAQALGAEFGVSYRSVISKAKQLGVEYIKQAPVAKKAKADGPTKTQTLSDIRAKLGLTSREGDLTKAELEAILQAI